MVTTTHGQRIQIENNHLKVPDHPIIPFIEGDGTGPDIWAAASRVLEAAVAKAYGDSRSIVWKEVLAGRRPTETGQWLPDETLETIRHYLVAIKGPLPLRWVAASVPSMWPCGRS